MNGATLSLLGAFTIWLTAWTTTGCTGRSSQNDPDASNPKPPHTLQPLEPYEWTQHAHNAQRTSYTTTEVPAPWRWKWSWNGPTDAGKVSSGKFRLPRNSQPVTGGGLVYIAAGSRGVFALRHTDGQVQWSRNPASASQGTIESTPAYDEATSALLVVASSGALYQLDASTGETKASVTLEGTSDLALPPAVTDDDVYVSMGRHLHAIDKRTMQERWRYDAGSPVETPPAWSATKNTVVVASQDLFVHAVASADGTVRWRSKPTPREPGDPGSSANLAEVSRGWPVIAEQHGLVLIKLRLDWQTLWRWNPWPTNNQTMRSNLQGAPEQQALLALNLDTGAQSFVANVGHGGFGDGDYMPMGPMPVVKRFDNGDEVAYVVMRGSPCLASPCDGRWDSHLGELMLDDETVQGFDAGHVRFVRNTFFPTDEQAYVSMAGDHLFGGHWMFGLAHQIGDRTAARGDSSDNPITTTDLPHIVTSTSSCAFSASHECPSGLVQDGDSRALPGGFYIYHGEGPVYDEFWSEYATWVVSRNAVFFVSTDGALVALEAGGTGGSSEAGSAIASARVALTRRESTGVVRRTPATTTETRAVVIHYKAARDYAGRHATVHGVLRSVFNNGKAVYLTFQTPHQGSFIVRIMKAHWGAFAHHPEAMYRPGGHVRVTGKISWYQGDPVIYVQSPSQIQR